MKKIIGMILGNSCSALPDAVCQAAMLEQFAVWSLEKQQIMCAAVLNDPKAEPYIAAKEHLNSSGADFCLILRCDCVVDDEGIKSAVEFCLAQNGNAKIIGKCGAVLGFVLSAVDTPDSKVEQQIKTEGFVIDSTNFSEAVAVNRAKVNVRLALEGVFLESAENINISPLAKIGKGTFIANGTVITGRSTIGEGCCISGGTYIEDSKIANNVVLVSSRILESEVGKETKIGPYSYIRPSCLIGANVKIGDFVEIKNSAIGDKTSVSHLTYVGDSDVGSRVNFGCGTVTVNYDGVKKHRTVIGDFCFIGCNTNLVSPVSIGKNAYIAAGSTITEDIPDMSFAIARQRQTVKENYVLEKKPDMIKE